ncbi:Uncharacterised protein [Legionella busanensis]|uniref:Uncharacterized protein n=1 Tax=Legionella busanensis TaxID=190655 RepID=A0A378JMK9_9GAMM|nr:hypothetical protein [Legionella busanensis]STX51439.1 Uncharacterised protein [Legionella busanensis]
MKKPVEIENLSSKTNTTIVENSIDTDNSVTNILDPKNANEALENSENLGSANPQNSPANRKKRTKIEVKKGANLVQGNNNNNTNKRRKSHKNPRFLEIEGTDRISFIVLNKNGIIEYAGIFKSSSDGDSFLLKQKNPYTGPNKFAYAYIVFTGEDENNNPVQIVFTLGIMNYGDSNHPGVRMFAQKVAQYLEIELKIKVHKKEYVYTGECTLDLPTGKTDLTIDDMETMVGEKLRYLQFNLKGTKSNLSYTGEGKPTLVTYLPRECILLSNEHTTAKGLRLSTPESYIDINGEVSNQASNGKEEEKEKNSGSQSSFNPPDSQREGRVSSSIGSSATPAFANQARARELSSIESSATPAFALPAHTTELSSRSSALTGFGFFKNSKPENSATPSSSNTNEDSVIELQ